MVTDAGLLPDQRRRLEEHVTVRSAERELPPYVLKLSPSLEPPADVLVLVDADMILTRPLAEPIEIAAAGKIVAFADPVSPRFFPEWAGLLGPPPLRRQAYINAGLLVLPDVSGRRLLGETVDLVAKLDIAETQHGTGSAEDPFFYYDQDVLNAVLSGASEETVVLDERLAPHPPFSGLELVDAETLRCRYPDGTEPFVVHHVLAKPWLAATRVNVYQRLLRRVLLAPDVPLRLDAAELPLRLRDGFAAAVDRARADLVARAGAVRGRLGLRRRLGPHRNG